MKNRWRLPHWTASRVALGAGVASFLVTLATLVGVGWFDRAKFIESQVAQGELLSRVLDDHATRMFDSTSLALATLAERFDAARDEKDFSQLTPALSQALVGLPFVRSIAVLDAQGRIVASSSAAEVGVRIDLARLGRLPQAGQDIVGPRLAGRQLSDLATPPGPSAVSFIPVMRRQPSDTGSAFIVAMVNPGAIATYHELALADRGNVAALITYDGHFLSLAGGVTPLQSAAPYGVFTDLRAGREHGSFIGGGFGSERRLVAYRSTPSWPLAVVVEQSYEAVLERWAASVRGFVIAGVLVLGFIPIMSWTAWRSLRAREIARRERNEAQARVAASERELSVVVESVQELIFRADVRGVLTFVNARWLALRGQTMDEAIGTRLRDLVDASQHAAIDNLLFPNPAMDLRAAQITVPSRDGGLRRFEVAVSPLRDGEMLLGFVGSAVDVTERWQAQQRLQAQLAFTELLQEISPVPVSMTDTSGHLLSVNRAWEEFTGHPRAQALGRSEFELLAASHAKEEQFHARQHGKLLEQGHLAGYEARVMHAHHSWRDVIITKVQVPGEAAAPAGVLSTMMDVSEFREAERATRAARDSAEETSRAKSEFIANISHELRTPLQAILGFSELGSVRAGAHERLATMFQDIHGSGTRMLALVNDLLDVAKIESTVGTFHLESTDLRVLARSVAQELEPLLQRRGLHLRLALSETPLLAKVDPLRFQQVLRNVLANAIKFSPDNEEISMLAGLSPSDEVHFQIRDHGPGIPPGELEAVFEAFVQSSTTKDGSGGTGLGLAISRKILAAHCGRIHAENLAEGGAAFHIFLPVRSTGTTLPAELQPT